VQYARPQTFKPDVRILSGWLLQTSGGYKAPMMAIFFFLILGGLTCLILLRPEWAPKLSPIPQRSAAKP
jgi:hypothetical protein